MKLGYYYLLMEYVDGVNLRQLQAGGRLTPREALAIVPPICEALQYAHDHGIVHRDIKPENLLVDQKGQVKIADFGIAKMIGTAEPTSSADQKSEHTRAGTALGTPAYMAPEQATTADVDHRADIYSLGVVLYEMLTGELPKESLEAPSRRVQIDVRLDEIVLRALEQNPEQRYQTVGEFGTILGTVMQDSEPTPAPAVPTETPARLSKTAVVGAIFSLFPAVFLMLFSLLSVYSDTHTVPGWLYFAIRFTLIPLGLGGPFVTTILGWMAVVQIRRSKGRLYGLGLALYDGLVYPLLIVNAIAVKALFATLPKHFSDPNPMFIVLIFLLVMANMLSILLLWLKLNGRSITPPGAAHSSWRWVLVAAFHTLLILAAFGAMAYWVPHFEERYDQMLAGDPLPVLTNLVFGFCGFLIHAGMIIVPLAVLANLILCSLLNRTNSPWPLRIWSALVIGGLLLLSLIIGTGLYLPLKQIHHVTVDHFDEPGHISKDSYHLLPTASHGEPTGPVNIQAKPSFVGIGILFIIPILLLGLACFALWIWMLIDCATHEPPGTDKVVWILIILFLNGLGALVYLLFRRPTRRREAPA